MNILVPLLKDEFYIGNNDPILSPLGRLGSKETQEPR
jgi:hypothetical protein